MAKSSLTLLHGEYHGQIEIGPSAPLPLAPSFLPPPIVPTPPCPPTDQELSATIKQIGHLVQDQLAPYQFDKPIRFKLHLSKAGSKTIRVRRYPHHYTVSLDLRSVESASLYPDYNVSPLTHDIAYQLIKRAHFSPLPYSLDLAIQSSILLSALIPLSLLLGIFASQGFFLLTFLSVVFVPVFIGIICSERSNNPRDGKLPRQLLRHWDEAQARRFIAKYGTSRDQGALRRRDSNQRQHQLQKTMTSRLKSINRTGDSNE